MLNSTTRQWQFDQLQKAVDVLGYIVRQTLPTDATLYRDGGAGWTVNEVQGHLLDFEPILLERARLAVEQDVPDLPFPDPDQLVIAGKYNERALHEVHAEWAQQRQALIAYYAARHEADWERTAKHPRRGPLTLDDQLLLTVWHDLNHIEQITHILAGRKMAK